MQQEASQHLLQEVVCDALCDPLTNAVKKPLGEVQTVQASHNSWASSVENRMSCKSITTLYKEGPCTNIVNTGIFRGTNKIEDPEEGVSVCVCVNSEKTSCP